MQKKLTISKASGNWELIKKKSLSDSILKPHKNIMITTPRGGDFISRELMLAVASVFVVDTTFVCLRMSSRHLLTAHECHFDWSPLPLCFTDWNQHLPVSASCIWAGFLVHLARITSFVASHTHTHAAHPTGGRLCAWWDRELNSLWGWMVNMGQGW